MEKDEVYVPKTRSDLGIPHLPNEEIDWEVSEFHLLRVFLL